MCSFLKRVIVRIDIFITSQYIFFSSLNSFFLPFLATIIHYILSKAVLAEASRAISVQCIQQYEHEKRATMKCTHTQLFGRLLIKYKIDEFQECLAFQSFPAILYFQICSKLLPCKTELEYMTVSDSASPQ